jgi:hypothetical protein
VANRHFINLPFVAPGSTVVPPKLNDENAVSSIVRQRQVAMMEGDREKRAVALTWLFHLVGDLHQPLHAVARFDADFPRGDKGGNLALVRLPGSGREVQLHRFWDGLLGMSVSRSAVLGMAREVEEAGEADPRVAADLAAHTTPESWALESFAAAVEFAYEGGRLKPANADDDPDPADIPEAGEDYAENAGAAARVGAYKAGKRLAAVLREVLAAD